MRTREIAHDKWSWFLGDFSHLHQGRHVNVETIDGGDASVHSRWSNLPLLGIVGADAKEGTSRDWISIFVGDSPRDAASVGIAHPSRVVIAEEDDGQSVALQIDAADGSATMLRFEPPRENMPEGFRVC